MIVHLPELPLLLLRAVGEVRRMTVVRPLALPWTLQGIKYIRTNHFWHVSTAHHWNKSEYYANPAARKFPFLSRTRAGPEP